MSSWVCVTNAVSNILSVWNYSYKPIISINRCVCLLIPFSLRLPLIYIKFICLISPTGNVDVLCIKFIYFKMELWLNSWHYLPGNFICSAGLVFAQPTTADAKVNIQKKRENAEEYISDKTKEMMQHSYTNRSLSFFFTSKNTFYTPLSSGIFPHFCLEEWNTSLFIYPEMQMFPVIMLTLTKFQDNRSRRPKKIELNTI